MESIYDVCVGTSERITRMEERGRQGNPTGWRTEVKRA